ncbi:hypothetical protein [Celeribacter marinus]|uniref:Uncharacterized protein n=1 Tax=Celeribacter marinus TaxID=1397108 RepID=A0A0P0ABC7_9RHOB|nr:hypothetical protein [Celeribacter marinus]ALI55294.1 hypothetical protein IMCC12053_1346 [Celeribacter marinus]SFK11977.1 hypothetical protein SAMN05444421_101497 [Celeribacter marinus]
MRPEVRALIWQWREVLIALLVVALMAWWAASSFGVVRWVALVVTIAALFLAFAAVQRARFGRTEGGIGAVEFDEGVVSYFTATTGGQIEIAAMTSVMLLPAVRGPAHWQLDAPAQAPLLIPLDAFGAEKLFDVFVTLNGIETEKMLRQIKSAPDSPVVIWRKRTVALH